MVTEIARPRTPVGKLWNRAIHRFTPARCVDDWWYERDHVWAMVLAGATMALVYGIGFGLRLGVGLTFIPTYAILTTAQISGFANEMHTLYLALRHRDKDLFDQPQTFERLADGRIVRNVDAASRVDAERRAKRRATRGKGVAALIRWHAIDYWYSHRRLPQFLIGVGAPALAFVLGAGLGAPLALVAGITYGGMALEALPEAVLAYRAKQRRSLSLFKKPQMVPRPEVETSAVVAPAAPTMPAMAAPRRTTRVDESAPAPHVTSPRRPDRSLDGV